MQCANTPCKYARLISEKKEIHTQFHILSAMRKHPVNTRASYQEKKEIHTQFHILSAMRKHPVNTRAYI